MTDALLVLHAGLTWFLAGLIWTVQLVHYPLFAQVSRETFLAYERRHTARISWIVAPAMGGELLSGGWLLLAADAGARGPLVLGAALLIVVWASTFLVQVPCHRVLGRGFDPAVHGRLVRTNWLRTATWTARSGLVGWLLLQRLG